MPTRTLGCLLSAAVMGFLGCCASVQAQAPCDEFFYLVQCELMTLQIIPSQASASLNRGGCVQAVGTYILQTREVRLSEGP